jgi:hypothetical protein
VLPIRPLLLLALAAAATPALAVPSVVVTETAPLYAAPDDSSFLAGHAYADQVLTVDDESAPWFFVERADGIRGWIAGDALAPGPTCRSQAVGKTNHGRLVCGRLLPAATDTLATWDFPLARSPSRPERRYGTDRLIQILERVAAAFHRAHPSRRLLVGDLSRPRGGDFGPQFGGVGHASHQNGLDADVYYPRRDGRERSAPSPAQVDLTLARDVIRRFALEPVEIMFVGCERDYVSASEKAEELCNGEHENHVHVRISRTPRTSR